MTTVAHVTGRRRAGFWLLLATLLLQTGARAEEAADGPPPPPPARVENVVMQTALGEIRLALEVERAPATAANFLRYVDAKRFDDIGFYRAVHVGDEGRYGLLQGGLAGDPSKVMPPVAHEAPAATGLSHLDGAISMAHHGPGTATADWFIVIGDLPSMDGKGDAEDPGYPVFGRVTAGMDVVRSILAQPRDPEAGEGIMKGQMFAQPVKILTVRRAD